MERIDSVHPAVCCQQGVIFADVRRLRTGFQWQLPGHCHSKKFPANNINSLPTVVHSNETPRFQTSNRVVLKYRTYERICVLLYEVVTSMIKIAVVVNSNNAFVATIYGVFSHFHQQFDYSLFCNDRWSHCFFHTARNNSSIAFQKSDYIIVLFMIYVCKQTWNEIVPIADTTCFSMSLVFRCANREFVYLLTVIESSAIGLVTLWTMQL